MDFLVCPADGAQLKVDPAERAARPLVVTCPDCGKTFTFEHGELRERCA